MSVQNATGVGITQETSEEDFTRNRPDHVTVDVPEAVVYSKILPHTARAGSPYYIGDAYEETPPPISQEWRTDSVSPYLKYIKSISTAWPHLKYLADFMEVGTTPLRWNTLRANQAERRDRSDRTNVVTLDFPSSGTPVRKTITSAQELESSLREISGNQRKSIPTRMIIVEDLSSRVIEILGSKFDIDPAFFRDHIDDYSWYNIRDTWMNPPNLSTALSKQSWTRVRFVRPRYFRTKESFQKARDESNRFNVLRRPDDDQNQWPFMDGAAIIGLIRTRALIWVGNSSPDGNGTTCVILVDPTVKEGRPLWHGYRNWAIVPGAHRTIQAPAGPPRTSLLEDLVHWMMEYPWFPSSSHNRSSEELQALLQPILYIACAEWLIMCEYIKARLGQIEWELGYPEQFRSDVEVIDVSLKRLHTWRRVIPLYREMLSETIEQAVPFTSRLRSNTIIPSGVNNTSIQSHSSFNTVSEDITPDFRNVLDKMKELQDRTDRLTSVVVAAISIEDSRRGLQENRNLARLTWLATIFIPLTFITGLFSMQSDIASLRLTFGWYFASAVPVTVLALAFAMNLNYHRWSKGGIRKRGEERSR